MGSDCIGSCSLLIFLLFSQRVFKNSVYQLMAVPLRFSYLFILSYRAKSIDRASRHFYSKRDTAY